MEVQSLDRQLAAVCVYVCVITLEEIRQGEGIRVVWKRGMNHSSQAGVEL